MKRGCSADSSRTPSICEKLVVLRIEKTSLVMLDDVAERERLQTVFKGKTRELLLSILDRFVEGRFEELALVRADMGRETAEYLHPVIDDVLCDTLMRMARVAVASAKPEDNSELLSRQRAWVENQGLPLRADFALYPKFEKI